MREIKFRGKCTGKKGWVIGNLIRVGQKYFISGFIRFFSEVYPESVGQSPGLKDSLGQEIYEGDILEEVDSSYIGHRLLVAWDKSEAGFKLLEPQPDGSWFPSSQPMQSATHLKIIGNKLESPELLEYKLEGNNE